MKEFFYLMVALVLVSCTDQFVSDGTLGNNAEVSSTSSEFKALLAKARWGDGQAYVKLADCYRDGKGVKQDFVGMLSMAAMACQYDGINHVEDYLNSLPENSEYRLAIEVLYKCDKEKREEAEGSVVTAWKGSTLSNKALRMEVVWRKCSCVFRTGGIAVSRI